MNSSQILRRHIFCIRCKSRNNNNSSSSSTIVVIVPVVLALGVAIYRTLPIKPVVLIIASSVGGRRRSI